MINYVLDLFSCGLRQAQSDEKLFESRIAYIEHDRIIDGQQNENQVINKRQTEPVEVKAIKKF